MLAIFQKSIMRTAFLFLIASPAMAQVSSTFEKMETSGTLRCGYLPWPPLVEKDPNTGEFSGLFFDMAQELSKSLGYKLDMAHEFGIATHQEDLNKGLFDVECSGGWANASRGKKSLYTRPIAFFPIVPVVSAKAKNMPGGVDWINDSSIKVAVMDGETSALIRAEHFSKSAEVSIPHTSASTDLLMQVATGKADVTFTDLASAHKFNVGNPGQIIILEKTPVRVVPMTFSVAAGQDRLLQVLNVALDQLIYDGVADRLLNKHDPEKRTFWRLEKPYQ